jgi:hypothetical protein
MKRASLVFGFLLVAAGVVAAHDVINPFLTLGQNPIPTGQPGGGVGTARGEFFADPLGIITVTAVTQTGDSSCVAGVTPLDVQFAQARGYAAANGFVLSNGFVDDLDDDGAAMGDPTACADPLGSMGANCTGVDPVLAMALGTAYGIAPVPTEDAAILKVDFTASAAATVDVSYEWMTLEAPSDPSFFDSFGILYDGTLLAGGKTNMGPPAGTASWSLTPSAPNEYQSIAQSVFHIVPAHHTGLKTLTIAVTPGAHSLEFHVADGGPAIACAGTTPAGCDIVPCGLFVGLHTYQSVPGAVCGAATISRVGHPAPDVTNGGHFPADLQVTLAGAPGSTPIFFVLGTSPGAFPGVGACGLFVSPIGGYFDIFAPGLTSPSGSASFPPAPVPVPPGVDGAQLYAQWFGINLAVAPPFFNTKGLRLLFGPG